MTVLGFYSLLRTLKQQFWGFEMHTGVVLGLGWPKRGFGPDSDPHGSKSGSEGTPWQLFSSRISWQPPNLAMMSKWAKKFRDMGRDFRIFRIFPKWKTAGLVG